MKTFSEAIAEAKGRFPEYPVYYGTGYFVHHPHILAIDRGYWFRVTAYPEGNNGLSGMGCGSPEINFN